MKYKTLQKIVDADTLSSSIPDLESGIVKYCFKINGAPIEAQSDPDNEGIYAFGIEGYDLLTLLGLDKNGESTEEN